MYATVKEIIERLSRMNPDEMIGVLVWDKDDVKEVMAVQRNDNIDDELAGEALHMVFQCHDSKNGIAWNTVVNAVDYIREEKTISGNNKF